MSSTLYWKPKSRDGKSLPDTLKFILRDKRGLEGEPQVWCVHELAYLNGLADADVEGAQELVDAIEKHKEVELWLEY